MIEVSDALDRILAATPLLGSLRMPLAAARQRVLAAPAQSACDLPPFTQSAVDGYAVRHIDIAGAPLALPLTQQITASAQERIPVLQPQTAARIFTGGMLPLGADTVVRQELTQRPYSDSVVIVDSVAMGADIRQAGEELRAGAVIARSGALLTPGLVGALAMAGVTEVSVRSRPRVVVLITGDEVVAAGQPRRPGQIADANGPLLEAQLAEWDCSPLRVEHVADCEERLHDALTRAFDDADLVLTTGGVSVGDFDFIPKVCETLGAERVLWKIAQKPGMPMYVARKGQAVLFGLPGNPASVMANLLVYVRSTLDAMQGLDPKARWNSVRAPLTLKRLPDKTFWMRAVVSADAEAQLQLQALGGQASHMLGNLAKANALVRVPGLHEAADSAVLQWLRL